MNRRDFLVLVSLSSAVVGCGHASPAGSTPDIQSSRADALPPTMSDAGTGSSDGARSASAQASPCNSGGSSKRLLSLTSGLFPTSDAAACITVDLCDYDLSCTSDADCMMVTSGPICTSECIGGCSNAAINVKSAAQYQEALAQLGPVDHACECGSVSWPSVFCVSGVCTYCPGGCPDADITGSPQR
jgi:hypothetical protein